MEKQILEIIKGKDDYKNVVEIKETAKGDPIVSVKVRGDGTTEEVGNEAIKEYKRAKQELAKK